MNKTDLNNQIEFDEEIVEVEKEIINFLITCKLFVKLKPLFIKILSFFITRKNLTQNDLQELTGLSAGTISQEINKMLENEILEVMKISESGQITYSMNSVPNAFMKFNINMIQNILKWENELKRIKNELEKNKKEFKKFKSFKGIYGFVNVIQPIMLLYKDSLEIINNLMES